MLAQVIEYLRTDFWTDVDNAGVDGPLRDLSLFSLRPTTETAAFFGRDRDKVESLDAPGTFVRAWYLWTYVDQALNTVNSEVHRWFEAAYHVPKPRGILGSYWYIWHPRFVLYAGAHYEPEDDSSLALQFEHMCAAASALFESLCGELDNTGVLWKDVVTCIRADMASEHRLIPQITHGRGSRDPAIIAGRRRYRRLCEIVRSAFLNAA